MPRRAAALLVVALPAAALLAPDRPSLAQDALPGPPPQALLEGHFATALTCARCHSAAEGATALRDAKGRPVAPFDLWRGTMMANSARDPLWRAQVAAEVAAVPSSARHEVVAECVRCHSPMAAHEARLKGEPAPGLEVLDDAGPRGVLARDGASCTTCHLVGPQGLGTEATYAGHLPIGEERLIYGPHPEPAAGPMRRFVNYTPTLGPHMVRSALCGTCHTLHTEGFGADGRRTGTKVLEQGPYLEWRNSVFSDEGPTVDPAARTCQACHLPTRDADGEPIQTRIARNPMGRDFGFTQPRGPFGRHLLVGGNVLVTALLRDHAAALGVEAPREAFDAALAATREQLERRTAKVALEGLRREGGRLSGRVRVENLTGHKLPTGIPVRRMWLRVRVRAGERVLVALGEHDVAGRLVGPDGAPRAEELAGGPVYPHRDVLAGPGDVQVWEVQPADDAGQATFRLLRAAGALKDDRLLPRGWSPTGPDAAATAPRGVDGDADFAGGGDGVRLDLPLPAGADGPLTVEAAVLYQPLGSRWAAELFTVDAPEVKRFRQMWEQADRAPVVVASAAGDVP